MAAEPTYGILILIVRKWDKNAQNLDVNFQSYKLEITIYQS